MTMLERVIEVCARETGQDKEQVSAETTVEGLGLDSLEFVSFMQAVGNEFWDVPEARWNEIETIADLERELVAAQSEMPA